MSHATSVPGSPAAAGSATSVPQFPNLSAQHLAMLRHDSGIADAVIAARGYRTITSAAELRDLGFAIQQCRTPGLLLPLHTPDGDLGPYVYRPDIPRSLDDRAHGRLPDGTYKQRVVKYELPKGCAMRLDCPPPCRPLLADPRVPLWLTEGQKKADALASQGLAAVALLGVWNFRGRNPFGGTTLLADFDYIAWDGRDVRIVFDSDVMGKAPVQQALRRLTEHLRRKRARVVAVYLPAGPGGRKVGVDDWLAAGHTVGELSQMVEASRPAPQPAAPLVELLDEPRPRLDRPLRLVDGRAYAAAWLNVRVTTRETVDRYGEIVRHDPPLVEEVPRLFVVRDDGRIFGEGGDAPAEDLGLQLSLAEMPPPEGLWRSAGVKAYRAGARPDPVALFQQVADVPDRFIDFARSLAGQRTMAEMVACYVLATWFLDAFTVIGFLWPSGDRGSGKTQLIAIVARLAYLGQLITAGGSFPCLRDLADYGATLAFDDAENLADERKTDPDKRALLLAGNRRGNTIPLKELGPDRRWRTRYVNTFCPRLFSATRLPDAVLASRTIVVPLIRTPDRYRANVDPEDPAAWPHPRVGLVDNLWALALAHLPELRAYEARVNSFARLAGRALEPWRAILAVAAWLDDQDTEGRLRRPVSANHPVRQGLGTAEAPLSIEHSTLSIEHSTLDKVPPARTAPRPGSPVRGPGEPGQAHSGIQHSLLARMEALSWAYQQERPELESADLVSLTIRALGHIATEATRAAWDGTYQGTVTTDQVRKTIIDVINDGDMPADSVTPSRVGRVLAKMRLTQVRRPGGVGSRRWRVTLDDLQRWTAAYGLPAPDAALPQACAGGAEDPRSECERRD